MAYVFPFVVVREGKNDVYFRYDRGKRGSLCAFLPAYPFTGGSLEIRRKNIIIECCDSIRPSGDGSLISGGKDNRLIAFHSLRCRLGHHGPGRWPVCWCLWPYEFLLGDELIFSVPRAVSILQELTRLRLYVESQGERYIPGEAPTSDFYSEERMAEIRKIQRRSRPDILRLVSGPGHVPKPA